MVYKSNQNPNRETHHSVYPGSTVKPYISTISHMESANSIDFIPVPLAPRRSTIPWKR